MGKNSLLLPANFRLTGFVLLLVGVVFTMLRFYFDFKPDFMHIKTYAVYSSYLDDKYFENVKNNLSDEVCGVILLVGLFIVAFTKDKVETANKDKLRYKAIILAFYIDFVFLIFSFLFTFGLAFMYMLILNMSVTLVAFILVFRILVYLNR